MIDAAAAQPGTHLLAASASSDGRLDALLCCRQHGDTLWLWGARTREELRSLGLASALLVSRAGVRQGMRAGGGG